MANPEKGVWGYTNGEKDQNGLPIFNGITGFVSSKVYDTSVSGHAITPQKARVLDFLPTVIDTRNGVYVRTSVEGDVTLKPYTHEFKVFFNLSQLHKILKYSFLMPFRWKFGWQWQHCA